MPRKTKPSPLSNPLIQGLSDHRTLKPQAELMATEFMDELAGGSPDPIPMKIIPVDNKPEYVRTAPIVRVSKRAELDKAIERRRKQLNNATRALLGLGPEPKPAHNQVHTESGKVITVQSSEPKPWRRL